MNYKPIIIVAGEPNSIFRDLFKTIKYKKFQSPLLLIVSLKLLKLQMKNLKLIENKSFEFKNLRKYKLDNSTINIIDINYNQKQPFEKISSKSNYYIEIHLKLHCQF